ncbi:MAG: hypothetical protein NTZ05_07410 [Chloroflexi bacterium]|nr:hypothetical protein [Chloroflexota bacterium]
MVVLGRWVNVYRDDGCKIALACLRCPLAVCRIDGAMVASRLRSERDREITRAVVAGGLAEGQAAERFGVSLPVVRRAMAAGRGRDRICRKSPPKCHLGGWAVLGSQVK